MNMSNFFEHLLSEQVGQQPELDGLVFESIESQNASWLKRLFEEFEVYDLVRKMDKNNWPN